MNIEKLRKELADDPLKFNYANLPIQDIADKLNEKTRTRVVEFRVTELGILNAFADPTDGEAVLLKLEAEATGNTMLARALRWMQPGGAGLDIGNNATRLMLDGLHAKSVIDAGELATVKALAEESISRAEELGLGVVRDGHIMEAQA